MTQTRRAAAAAKDGGGDGASTHTHPSQPSKGKARAVTPPDTRGATTESDVPPTAAAAPAGPARALAAGAGGSNLNKEPLDPTFLARLATGMLPIATDAGKIHSLARRLKAITALGAWQPMALATLPKVLALLPDDQFMPAEPHRAVADTEIAPVLAEMLTSLHSEGLDNKPHAAAATHVLSKVADICEWGGITGKKAAVDALFGPLVMPTLNVALDPAARSSVRFAALEALARGVGRSKSAASAIVHADKAAWRALAGSTLPTAGDYGVQVNTTYLMYAALKAGVAGALDAGALGDREAEAALRGLARRTASSFDWDTEARALLTAYNGRRGNSASVISVKATYVVAKGPGGVAAAEDEDAAWVDFGVPGAAGGSRKAGPHANVFLAVHGEASDEIMLTIPYDARTLRANLTNTGGIRLTVALGSGDWELEPPAALLGADRDGIVTVTLDFDEEGKAKLACLGDTYTKWINNTTAKMGKVSIATMAGPGAYAPLSLRPTAGGGGGLGAAAGADVADWIREAPTPAHRGVPSPSPSAEEAMIDKAAAEVMAAEEEAIQCAQSAPPEGPPAHAVGGGKAKGRLAALGALGGSARDAPAAAKKRPATAAPPGPTRAGRKAKPMALELSSTSEEGETEEEGTTSEEEVTPRARTATAAPARARRAATPAAAAAALRPKRAGLAKAKAPPRPSSAARAVYAAGPADDGEEIERATTQPAARTSARTAAAGRPASRARPQRAAKKVANARLAELAEGSRRSGSQPRGEEEAAPPLPLPRAGTKPVAGTKAAPSRRPAAHAFDELSDLVEEEAGNSAGGQVVAEAEAEAEAEAVPWTHEMGGGLGGAWEEEASPPAAARARATAAMAVAPFRLGGWDNAAAGTPTDSPFTLAGRGAGGGGVGGARRAPDAAAAAALARSAHRLAMDSGPTGAAGRVGARGGPGAGGSRPRGRREEAQDDAEGGDDGAGINTIAEGVARALGEAFAINLTDSDDEEGGRGGGGGGGGGSQELAQVARALRKMEDARRARMARKMAALASQAKAATQARVGELATELKGKARAAAAAADARAAAVADTLAAAEGALQEEIAGHQARLGGLWSAYQAAAADAERVAAEVQAAGAAAVGEARAAVAAARADCEAALVAARRKADHAKAKWAKSNTILGALHEAGLM